MKFKILNPLEYLNTTFIIALFIWISFFPQPIQEKYHLFTNISLVFIFLIIFAKKRFSIFKLNDYPLCIFLVTISINVLFAQQKNIAFKTYWDLAIPMFCIYYLMKEAFSSEKRFDLLAKTICLSSIFVSLGGILESLFRYNPIYEHFIRNPYYLRYITGFVRPMSTQFNPVVLGSYLLGALPFNFLLFKQGRPSFRLLAAMAIVLNVVVIIFTFSRGVFLGLIVMIIFYLFMQRKYRLIFTFFIGLVLFILLCSYLPYPFNRLGKEQMMVENRGILSDYRFTRCAMTWRIIKEHPLAGLGFQHFRSRFYEYSPSNYNVPYEFMIADNMYLTLLAETGIIGALGFFIFIGMLFTRWLKKIKEANGDRKQMLLIPMFALIGLLVNMGAYELFYWANPYMFFCVICGLVGL